MVSRKKAAPSRARPPWGTSPPPKPPQPRPVRNYGSIQLHFAALISYAISFEYLYSHPNKISQGFGGHYHYLANIVLVLSTLIALLGALEDMNAPRAIQSLKAHLLFLATPLSLLITLTWWTLYLTSPSLLLPTHATTLPPLKKDITFHLLPTLFLLVDLVNFTPRRCVFSPLRTLGVFGIFGAGYAGWLWLCWTKHGFVPYSFLEEMGIGELAVVGLGGVVVLVGVSVGLEEVCKGFGA